MKNCQAKKLRDGNIIEYRFSSKDTFTPGKWEPGIVEGEPVEIGGNVFVSIMLFDGDIFLSRVSCDNIRKSKNLFIKR